MEPYERILAGLVLVFGMAIAAYFVWNMVKDMRTPINIKWVYSEDGRFEGVVVA
jgi:hypothetical protein